MNSKLLDELFIGVGISSAVLENWQLTMSEDDRLPSCFKVTEIASGSLMAAACALAEYCQACDSNAGKNHPLEKRINVDNRLASLWFDKSLSPLHWQLSGLWDSIAGDYKCGDGWIRLHTNASHHREAALRVLKCDGTRESVSATLSNMRADDVELAIVSSDGCAATMRSLDAWQQHPQGIAVAAEPLIHWHEQCVIESAWSEPTGFVDDRPLTGLRVLDLTRVIAGPVSTRFLAAYGANVLRIDPAGWVEPGVVPEVTLGKRCAHLELKTPAGREQMLELLKTADVLVHGYRPGAMARLGLDEDVLLEHNPGLINVSLCAYGWTGPWSLRRGFDSLVQMSCGIAHQGMLAFKADKPYPLPVQALDHATGYLMAAAVLRALAQKRLSGRVFSAKLSLARTAHLVQQYQQDDLQSEFNPMQESDLHPYIENTTWGDAQRVCFPVAIDGISAGWDRPASDLRLSPAHWF